MCLTKTWQSTSWLLQKKMDSTWTQSARFLKIEVTTSLGRFLWDPKCSASHGVSWVMMGPFRSALRLLAKRPYGTGWVSMLRFMRTAGCAHFAWPLAAWIKDLRQPHAPSSYTQVEFIDFFPETCCFFYSWDAWSELPVSDCQACSRKRTAARGLFRSW